MMPIATANALSLLRLPGGTATLQLLLLTNFAAVATAIAYADASVVSVALLTVFKAICCCYGNCYDASCYYDRVIASTRSRTNCYAATATANEFCYNCYNERVVAITRSRTNCYAATATANEFCYNCYCDRFLMLMLLALHY